MVFVLLYCNINDTSIQSLNLEKYFLSQRFIGMKKCKYISLFPTPTTTSNLIDAYIVYSDTAKSLGILQYFGKTIFKIVLRYI